MDDDRYAWAYGYVTSAILSAIAALKKETQRLEAELERAHEVVRGIREIPRVGEEWRNGKD